ncbi:hypothetical protein MYAM1_002713 [Malassezia yamatoensis]|uniref:Uncharacterized protein n=1 Tax=Malassezia yamatoensis TaxID=253288 RepID=A0AAJ5YYM4_9BASI|nr:hypothetical protein MYAM1_002713 [Malassezia yamatoensis]
MGAAKTDHGPPDDVPLDWLSVRSLMDYCMGRGKWKSWDAVPLATSVADLPRLTTRDRVQRVLDTLETRTVSETQFVQWYNALVRSTWRESAEILQELDHVPPFVLQRALSRVESMAETSSAVDIATKHIPTYSVDNATRITSLLLTRCLSQRAWHVAPQLVRHTLDLVRACISRRNPQKESADALLRQTATLLLQAEDDPRARQALLNVISTAQIEVPSAFTWIQQHVLHIATSSPKRSRQRRPSDWVVDVDVVDALLEKCDASREEQLLTLGVKLAAIHRDTARAELYYSRLRPESQPTEAMLQALAHSQDPNDVQAAWTLFESMMSNTHTRPIRLAEWMLMLRIAAAEKRIRISHVLALLQLYEMNCFQEAKLAWDQWRVPQPIADQLIHARVAYTSVIDGLLMRNELQIAIRVGDQMIRRGIVPDAALLTSLCKVHLRLGQGARALSLVAQWCHEGVLMPPTQHGWLCIDQESHAESSVGARSVQDIEEKQDSLDFLTTDTIPSRDRSPSLVVHERHHVKATTYLANTLLEGLLQLKSYQTVFQVWRVMRSALHVKPDVVSLDLMLRAVQREAVMAIARGSESYASPEQDEAMQSTSSTPTLLRAFAARDYMRRTLEEQHPEIKSCPSAMESSTRNWLLSSEQRWRRWERWLESTVSTWFSGASEVQETEPHLEVTVPMALDARVFHRYAVLLATLLEASGSGAVAEELFRIPAIMRHLQLDPLRGTLCLLFCVQDTQLPPGIALRRTQTPLYTMLNAWLGQENLPSEKEIGEWYRRNQRNR